MGCWFVCRQVGSFLDKWAGVKVVVAVSIVLKVVVGVWFVGMAGSERERKIGGGGVEAKATGGGVNGELGERKSVDEPEGVEVGNAEEQEMDGGRGRDRPLQGVVEPVSKGSCQGAPASCCT